MSAELDVIALARQAGLCFPDCHFLDADPYEDLFGTLLGMSEAQRADHLALVKEEERKRQERLHQLELFAALVIRAARDQVQAAAALWQEEDFVVWAGAIKAASRLEIEAMRLEVAHQPQRQEALRP